MPLNIHVNLIAVNDGCIPPFTGDVVRKVFFNIIGRYSEDLARRLHDVPGVKSYSIKPLFTEGRKLIKHGKWHIEKGARCAFGFGFVDPSLEDDVLSAVIDGIPETIRIGSVEFSRHTIEVSKHNFERLLGRTISYFGLGFRTPTFFSIPRRTIGYLVPEPVRIFRSLMNIWNSYCGKDYIIEEDFLNWVSENVYPVVIRRLYTRSVDMEKGRVVGLKGSVAYVIRESDVEEAEILYGLIKLGLISNVGAKRTFGFGVISVYDIARKEQIRV